MNFEGLRRRGFSPQRISAIKAMHKALYRDNLTLEQALERMATMPDQFPEAVDDIGMMRTFLQGVTTQRGIVR
jgi:UDP-N-acetylglucosamine acyltransferase